MERSLQLVERDVFQLERDGRRAADTTYVRLLRACGRSGAIAHGKRIHRLVSALQIDGELSIAGSLMKMYLRCGNIQGAHVAFSAMDKENVDSWNSGIAAFADNGHLDEAYELLLTMEEVVSPSSITYTTLLNGLLRNPSPESLARAREIHHGILKKKKRLKQKGLHLCIGTSLVNVYAKCGCLDEARGVFDNMFVRDVALWSSMIAAYAHSGHSRQSFVLFRKMLLDGIKPNAIVFVNVLGGVQSLGDGLKIRSLVDQTTSLLEDNVLVATALTAMYGRCGSIGDAVSIFESIPRKDIVAWNAMIGAYSRVGQCKGAITTFERIISSRKPNRNTFVTLLGAFVKPEVGAASSLSFIREEIARNGLNHDVVVSTALISAYGKCGLLAEARRIFDSLDDSGKNSVTWKTMISACIQNNHYKDARKLTQSMQKECLQVK